MAEQITAEEMKAGTQPTRLEKIMFTPVEEILLKETWDDIDVEVLVRNKHLLKPEVLERLGITNPVPLAPEVVEAQTAALGPVPEETAPASEIISTLVVETPVGDTSTTVDNQPVQIG